MAYISGDPAQDRRGSTDRLHIGDGSGTNRSWVGRIDEVKLFNRLVADHEIHWLMNPHPINHAPALSVANLGTGPNTTFSLEADLSDDGLPDPPAEVTTLWTLEDGPDGGVIGSPSNLDSTFTSGSMSGTYVLRLTADDGGAKVSMTALIQSEGGEPRAPSITGHPQSQSVPEGGTATFSVSFDAEPYPDFAWYKDGVLLPDATGPILTLNGVTAAGDAGNYYVVVGNPFGSEQSQSALLSLLFPPAAPVLSATAISHSSIELSWIGTADSFEI